jgi:uncharacterized membrane protein YfhO
MVPISGDGVQYFSMKLFLNNALKSGELPLWNPYLSNGVPYASDLNGVFYPISLLLSPLPIKLFIYSYYSVHMAIGAFFTYLFLKEINCDKVVSICTSFIYLLSIHLNGYRKSHMVIIVAVIFLPVVLYFIERYIKTRSIKYLIASSAVMALAVLSGGHIQNSIYADMAVFVYFGYRLISCKVPIKKIISNIILWGLMFLGFVAIQLIPAIELLLNYRAAGASETSYETFASYSIHPIKIVMMLFPNMFGTDVMQPLGGYYSSEMDIELFLGVGILLFILFAVKNYWNDNRVKIATIFMGCAFIYSANAHIPVLNKFIYHFPILGGFRCSARMLFVFIFFGYVLFAVTLTKLKELNDLERFSDFILKVFVLLIGILMIVTPFIYIVSSDSTGDILKIRYSNFQLVYMKPIMTILIIVISIKLLNFIQSRKRIANIIIYPIISILMLIITVTETSRFSTLTGPAYVDDFGIKDTITQKIKGDIGNSKLWLANTAIDGSNRSIIEYNSNVSMEISALNSYMTFNNPRLFRLFTNENIMKPYYNFSGLLTGFPSASNNLLYQNDLLSMLGIRYIIDPLNLINEKGSIVKSIQDDTVIYTNSSVVIPNQFGSLHVFSDKISIEPNTHYKLAFQADTTSDQAIFYADFYGGEAYDNPTQNANFNIKSGTNTYEAMINSEDSTVATEVELRFVTNPVADINISNITITKIALDAEDNVYIPYYIDDQNRIYENTKVKDILFAPSTVKRIDDVESIYENVNHYDLDDVSYIEDYGMDYVTGTTTITDIVMKRNSVKAKVSADDKTFVNFSQNFYPGWKAYVDGKRTEVYMVNGLIQGIEVPSGEHTVTFRYIPSSVIIGALISISSILLAVFICRRARKSIDKSQREKH